MLGLANVFGQRPGTAVARTSRADLSLYSPSRLRGGLLFSSRFHINAHSDLKKATLVLDPGWVEGMSVNTIEPSPLGQGEQKRPGHARPRSHPRRRSYILWIQEQVNATNVAWRRPASVELDDGSRVIARIHHTFTIYP